MGLFDFLKKKPDKEKSVQVVKQEVASTSNNAVATYFDGLTSLDRIFKLLWFADGKFKNYDPEQDQKVLFENELFRITFSFGSEPSLLSSKLPIKPSSFSEACQSIGYYPSYECLTPEQRWIYLNWLKDIRQQVDVGYVFIFYYGLERHLLYGNYKDAVDVILLLRKYHENHSFQGYSLKALLLAAILRKDEDTLDRALATSTGEYPDNLVLIAKYLTKKDIKPEEIMALTSFAGFRNKRYINMYPEMFKDVIASKLKAEFGKGVYPVYNLDADFELKRELVFANISLPEDMRSPSLPSIVDNPAFKDSIMQLLSSTHEEIKATLAQMRKEGIRSSPKESTKKSADDENNFDSVCPYCASILDKPPKKKKKCPQCGNFIYVRSSRVLFPSTCLTEDEAFATDEYYNFKEYGFEKEDFFAKHRALCDKHGDSISYTKTCISVYEELILEKTELFQLQSLYFRIALLKYKQGEEFFPHLQQHAKLQLTSLKQKGYDRVKISSIGSCEMCQQLNGRVLSVNEALKEKPIPNMKCTHEIEKGKLGWCMCHYEPFIEQDFRKN